MGVFARTLEGRVPEDTLLSYDLFEGLFARAGLASDIVLNDEFPKAYNAYAERRGVHWGISESGYAGVDFEHTYQYRAFGVPGLGLKRGLSEDLVISPYSTFLAMMIAPQAALQNLTRLEKMGMRGEYGLYESIDFTPDRLGRDEEGHIVRSFLAHHQGMTLLALNNVLSDNTIQRRFHANPLIRAVERLLQEKFPERAPLTVPHQAELSQLERKEEHTKGEWSEIVDTPHTTLPRTRVLSNGYYSLMVDNAGSGFSFLPGNDLLTRWREDALQNSLGNYVFVKDLDSKKVWSTTYQPTRREPEFYEAIYNADKVDHAGGPGSGRVRDESREVYRTWP